MQKALRGPYTLSILQIKLPGIKTAWRKRIKLLSNKVKRGDNNFISLQLLT